MTTSPTSASPPRPSQPPGRRRLGLPLVLALVLGLAVGRYACNPPGTPPGGGGSTDAPATAAAPATAVWTCSMHPQIRLPEHGSCPICGMALAEKTRTSDAAGPRQIEMSPSAISLAGIETQPVTRRFVTVPVRMVGKVDYDERVPGLLGNFELNRPLRLTLQNDGAPGDPRAMGNLSKSQPEADISQTRKPRRMAGVWLKMAEVCRFTHLYPPSRR